MGLNADIFMFSSYDKGLKSSFIKKKFISYLLISTL